jgi:hypothetical protein
MAAHTAKTNNYDKRSLQTSETLVAEKEPDS